MVIYFDTSSYGIIAMHMGDKNMQYMWFTTIEVENGDAIVVNNPSTLKH